MIESRAHSLRASIVLSTIENRGLHRPASHWLSWWYHRRGSGRLVGCLVACSLGGLEMVGSRCGPIHERGSRSKLMTPRIGQRLVESWEDSSNEQAIGFSRPNLNLAACYVERIREREREFSQLSRAFRNWWPLILLTFAFVFQLCVVCIWEENQQSRWQPESTR